MFVCKYFYFFHGVLTKDFAWRVQSTSNLKTPPRPSIWGGASVPTPSIPSSGRSACDHLCPPPCCHWSRPLATRTADTLLPQTLAPHLRLSLWHGGPRFLLFPGPPPRLALSTAPTWHLDLWNLWNPFIRKKIWGIFRPFVAKQLGQRCELAWVFGSNVPLALLIDPWTFHVDVLTGKKVWSEKPKHFWS